MNKPIVWTADIGSVEKKHFGWCRSTSTKDYKTERDICNFAEGIAIDLSNDKQVAIGFECPLFIPVTDDPSLLMKARGWEGNRAWSASGGIGSLVTGLNQCVWIFEKIKLKMNKQVPLKVTFDWNDFKRDNLNIFIWEAFVTGSAKGKSHEDDAKIAAKSFWEVYPDISKSSVEAENPYSLVGAALLRSGLSKDISLLSKSCIVLRS